MGRSLVVGGEGRSLVCGVRGARYLVVKGEGAIVGLWE